MDKVDLRPERHNEILTQIGIPMQYWATVLDLNPTEHKYTLELMFVALQMLSHVNQFAKHVFACPRPALYSPAIQPLINPRRFGAFPSGHAAEAYLIARILQVIVDEPKRTAQTVAPSLDLHLQRLAYRISDNRVVAGVHFPIDSTAGRIVGETFAEYFLSRCTESSKKQLPWSERRFKGDKITTVPVDFEPFEDISSPGTTREYLEVAQPAAHISAPIVNGQTPLLCVVWEMARNEWR